MKFFEKPRLSQRNFSGKGKESRLIFPASVTLGLDNEEEHQAVDSLNIGLFSPVSEYS